MLYVSDITRLDGAKVQSMTYWPFKAVPYFEVEVTDTVTGVAQMMALSELDGVVGYYRRRSAPDYGCMVPNEVVLKHSKKAALLWKYVSFTCHEDNVDVVDDGDMDSYVYDNFIVDDPERPKQFVGINIGDINAVMCGSVLMIRDSFSAEKWAVTLYDTLCKYCRACQCNLMQYKRIAIYSRRWSSTNVIFLSQTPEAKRFYTKMYIDALSGRVGDEVCS